MNIGFDAKRAFQNRTGLGNYSRTLIQSLAEYYPQHRYFLFAPRLKPLFQPPPGARSVQPEKALHRLLKPVWRSRWIMEDLRRHHIGLYHGLSGELPAGIGKSGISSVVTMHDLIFERYPDQYNPIDVVTYRKKAQYACRHASQVIAISGQTRQDLIDFYQVPEERITVAYQSCDPSFMHRHTPEEIESTRTRYGLPAQYFLYVGSVIERKNLLGIAKAMAMLKDRLSQPLVVVGDGRKYKEQVRSFLREAGLQQKMIWLNETGRFAFKDLPALYQGATALLYPSLFEGFGIPILEALCSRTPVITSQGSCFLETAGDAALYIDPLQPAAIAGAMMQVTADTALAEGMRERGWLHAQQFTREKCADAVMQVYAQLCPE